jgi:hypothetical protein
MSQRNVVKGMGWAQRGSMKSIPVCRVCDEVMVNPKQALLPDERSEVARHALRAELTSSSFWVKTFAMTFGIIFLTALLVYFFG